MTGFLDALNQRVLVCDGAMGTMLYVRGVFLNRCFDELNLTHPDLIAEVHREYVRAGADVIETNTFGANRFKLANFGLADQVQAINAAGAAVAVRAAAGRAFVAGSIGPLGVRIEPWGRTGVDEAEAAFREQASALAEGGVDLFILETFRDLNEIQAAIRAVRQVSARPIVAQMTTEADGNSLDGSPPETFAAALTRAGADVVGVNCAVGPAAMLETIEAMAPATAAPLAAQPNAGAPRDVDGRTLYLSSPEYMASYARRFIRAGVRLVGGCCGTTPEHIRQMVAAVRAVTPAARQSPSGAIETPAPPAEPLQGVERRAKSRLGRALADGQFVIIADASAPRGLDLSLPVHQAQRCRDLGATAVSVPDYPRSGARASALALAVLLEQGGVETILHYTCRDRTLINMQSDLVGAHAMGVRNVLLTTGNPAPRANYADATSVFDVDAIGLVNIVVRLNQGLDIAGQPLGAPTQFHIGVGVNPFAPDPDAEWRRLDHKIQAGAEFIVTPPVLDLAAFDAVCPRLLASGVPVLAGVAALEGLRHAEFLASEIPGVRVATSVLDRLAAAADDRAEAEAITVEIARHLRTRVQGLQITSLRGTPATSERLLRDVQPLLSPIDGAGAAETLRHA